MSVPNLRFTGFDGDWKESRLKDLALKITDGTHDTPVVQKEGIPFLTAINVKDGFINYDDIGYVDEITHKKIYERCNPEKDDLLIVNIGAGTATCARNIVDYQFSLKNVALVKPNRNLLNPIFLEQIQRKNSSRLFTSLTSGGAQPFLSLKEIGKLLIKYPSLEEQTKIASFLSAVDEKISQLTQKHELLSQYKQGMMQKLFSQQFRFKADDGSEFGEWENTVLGDIADIVGGGTPSTNNEEYWSGDVVWLTPSEINQKFIGESKRTISELGVQKSSAKKLPIGTILFTSRATIGEVAIAIAEVTTNQGFQSFISNEKTFNEFLYYWIVNNKKSFIERASGSTFLEISKSKIQPMEISLPCLEEQTKIANFLSAIDQKIEVVAQQIEQAKTWKKGLLQQMFV
jgi:type I restriction enzyme S subunit